MRTRNTLGMLGSDGFGPNMFVEREPTDQGWRVAVYVHQSMRLVEESTFVDSVESVVEFRRQCHKAVDAMFDGGVR